MLESSEKRCFHLMKSKTKQLDKEVVYWRTKWTEEFVAKDTLKRQYAGAQDIIAQYIQGHSKLCYRCKAKDKLPNITL